MDWATFWATFYQTHLATLRHKFLFIESTEQSWVSFAALPA
jgi:hypothetical protein